MKQTFYISNHDSAKTAMDYLFAAFKGRFTIKAAEWRDTRSSGQNRLMWKMLTDISQQVEWHGVKYSKEDWKHIFTASLKGQRAAPMVDGSGMVFLGQSTSRMTITEMTELIDYMDWFGTEREVTWSNNDD